MARKYISLFLVGLFLLHLAGFYIYFSVRVVELHMTMKQQLASLPAHQLSRISLSMEEFQSAWREYGEMEWEGKMYDIARVEYQGNRVTILCLRDMAEDNLLEFISAVVDKSSQDNDPAPTSVVQFFILKFVVSPLSDDSALSDPLMHQSLYSRCNTSADLIPVTPPPRG